MTHTRIATVVSVGVSVYILLAFTSPALAPVWERVVAAVRTEAPAPPPPEPVILSFVGDMMFDRYVREKAAGHGYEAIIRDVLPLFASSTYVFGNLEGPITESAPVSSYRDPGPDHYRFTFATSVVPVLAAAGVRAVTLGNNHSMNFGPEGLAATKRWLGAYTIGYVGAPDEPLTPWRTATQTREFALYAYDPWHMRDVDPLMERIAGEATSTFVILLTHWGEEYDTVPNAAEVALAHRFVDAGADLIVGSHPHVIQSKERYHDTWVYYSLGNFVFDQYFTDDVRCGAVLTVTVMPDGAVRTAESFIELARDGTTKLSDCKAEVASL